MGAETGRDRHGRGGGRRRCHWHWGAVLMVLAGVAAGCSDGGTDDAAVDLSVVTTVSTTTTTAPATTTAPTTTAPPTTAAPPPTPAPTEPPPPPVGVVTGLPPAVRSTAERILAAARAGDLAELGRLAAGAPGGFTFTFGDPPGDPVPYWRSNPGSVGTMVEVLQRPPATDGAMWWYPGSWVSAGEEDPEAYGPRLGIESDGTWTYFILGGD